MAAVTLYREWGSGLPSTQLVQRLHRPLADDDSPLARLRDAIAGNEPGSVLRRLYRYDYMGAAEYEFGAVREATLAMVNAQLMAWSFVPTAAERHQDHLGSWRRWHGIQAFLWEDARAAKREGKRPPRQTAKYLRSLDERLRAPPAEFPVFVVSDRAVPREDVRQLIVRVAQQHVRPKGGARFSFDPEPGEATVGWFDLTNYLMWFTDESMWERVTHAFGAAKEE